MNIILTSIFVFNSLFAPLAPSPAATSPVADNLTITDNGNLIDTATTLATLEDTIGRSPSIEEVFYIILQSQEIDQQDLIENYRSFCRPPICTSSSLIRFLSNYDVWFDEANIIDINSDLRALEFYSILLNGKISRDTLYQEIDNLLISPASPPILSLAPVPPAPIIVEITKAEMVAEELSSLEASPITSPYDLNVEIDNIPLGTEDLGDLIDVERTYNQLVRKMGREPTIEEILYMTIWSEYWLVVGNSTSRIGQDAVARSYYHFCGQDSCTHEELIKFLSGYQPWFARPGTVDINTVKASDKLYMLLTHEFNYDCCGEFLYEQIDEILDLEIAISKRWTDGKTWQRASQWYGPAGPPPKGVTYGYGTNDFAIVAIKYPNVPGAYFYFFTWEQELAFSPSPIP